MTRIQHGPGPIIQGQDITNPERFIVQQAGVPGVQVMSQAEIAAIPIRHQWFSGTANGLLATWWNRDIAEQHAREIGVIYGQIHGLEHDGHPVPVLCDPQGRPLRYQP